MVRFIEDRSMIAVRTTFSSRSCSITSITATLDPEIRDIFALNAAIMGCINYDPRVGYAYAHFDPARGHVAGFTLPYTYPLLSLYDCQTTLRLIAAVTENPNDGKPEHQYDVVRLAFRGRVGPDARPAPHREYRVHAPDGVVRKLAS